ncbi:hypothetical protein HPB47_013242 [Ixodes persulcatus]|uniref:Uncharacterized protein n=1 Tax=Ixodes persulcatus TaxID=34615 RepID=A0AC60QYZ2_IXOPE|nr:hypothetical protein HPB47_013242 [Ixodes persulcatus]
MHSYTISRKVEVIDWHRASGKNVSRTSRHFKIDRKRIREWDSKYDMLKHQDYGKQKMKRKLTDGGPVFSEELDDALFDNRLLAEEALRIAVNLNLGNFKASSQYIKRWKKRFGVTMRVSTNDSQKAPADCAEAVNAFRARITSLRTCHDYTPYNIANMDQTMVRMDNPVTRTNNVAGESSIRIANTGCARRGFTVALAARASANVRLTSSKNGWMTTEKCLEWLNHVWGPDTDDARRLLVIDQAPIHKTKAVVDAAEAAATDIAYIPGGCTGILQPADVYWNKSFKSSLRSSWAEFMRKGEKTAKGNLKKPSRQDVLNFVSAAWATVPEEIITRSLKGCGISGALDGSEDGHLHDRLAGIGEPAIAIPSSRESTKISSTDVVCNKQLSQVCAFGSAVQVLPTPWSNSAGLTRVFSLSAASRTARTTATGGSVAEATTGGQVRDTFRGNCLSLARHGNASGEKQEMFRHERRDYALLAPLHRIVALAAGQTRSKTCCAAARHKVPCINCPSGLAWFLAVSRSRRVADLVSRLLFKHFQR